MDAKTFSERLRALAAERNDRYTDLANLLCVSTATVARYFTGRIPDTEYLCKLADRYKVTVEYLIGLSEIRSSQTVNEGAVTDRTAVFTSPSVSPSDLTDTIRLIRSRGLNLNRREMNAIRALLQEAE